jgi:hypothetical protein
MLVVVRLSSIVGVLMTLYEYKVNRRCKLIHDADTGFRLGGKSFLHYVRYPT